MLTPILLSALLGTPLAPPAVDAGPFVGHVTPRTASVWACCARPGTYELTLTEPTGRVARVVEAVADPENDLCVVWTVDGLRPGTEYFYRIAAGGRTLVAGEEYRLTTAPAVDARGRDRVAFVSCALEDDETAVAWDRVALLDPDALILLGDTPYIDTTELDIQRQRYREFAQFPSMAAALHATPMYGTWDDHDFGENDTDGNLPGKENSRQAFIEYRANPSYGDGVEGIYTDFRRGSLHVILLDTRYFAATEPSPVDPGELTLLGAGQWEWLLATLKASDAPVKVIACGMIWNEAVRPGKTDHWGTYAHEREALFRFIGDEGIEGVVLVGGDIHRSRVIRHDVADLAGYDLIELIVSPLHDHIIEEANQPHPGLIVDMGEPHAVLVLTTDTTAEPHALEATFINADGDELFHIDLTGEVGLGSMR